MPVMAWICGYLDVTFDFLYKHRGPHPLTLDSIKIGEIRFLSSDALMALCQDISPHSSLNVRILAQVVRSCLLGCTGTNCSGSFTLPVWLSGCR